MADTGQDRNGASGAESRNPGAVVEGIVRRSGSSFYWAMRSLPSTRRQAIYAVYAFCREVDDIADGDDPAETKRAQIDEWGREIERLYAGEPSQPITRALLGPVGEFDLAKSDFLAVIEGMKMDAGDQLRIADADALAEYCDRVAGAVGRLSNRIFGVAAEDGNRLATALGEALQLTNILRDVREDAMRGHIYLPADALARHGIAPGDGTAMLSDAALPSVCAEIADLADRRFDEARAVIKRLDRRAVRPAVMMMAMYRRILEKLKARGWGAVGEPVELSKWEKIAVAARAYLFPLSV